MAKYVGYSVMRRVNTVPWSVVVVCLLLLCPHPGIGQSDAQEADFAWRFSVSEQLNVHTDGDAASARLSGHAILISGRCNTGCGTERVSGAVNRRTGDTLTTLSFSVRAHMPAGNACMMVDTTYEYQFAFPVREELPHEVRVLHIRHAETGSPPLLVAGGYLRRS